MPTSFRTFKELRAQLGKASSPRTHVVPVYESILADLDTPVSAFLKAGGGEYSFLLESVDGGEKWGRYSFIGTDPAFVVRAHGNRCELVEGGRVTVSEERPDPLEFLAEQMARFEQADAVDLPRFAGGAVGFFGYDAVRWWEKLPDMRPKPDGEVATLVFVVPRTVLAFDNVKNRIVVIRLAFVEPGSDGRAEYDAAVASIERAVAQLRAPMAPRPVRKSEAAGLQGLGSREAYEAAVDRIKEYVRAGDCFQVVPSHRFRIAYEGDDFDFYRALRAVNPSPYMFFLNYPELVVVGASPEVMVRVEGSEVLVSPIAGTRPRGASRELDLAHERDLLADPKERAEHVMLVDLARNDIGRIAATGSVRVDNLMHIERYSSVMHIVSDVRGRLAPGKTCYDAVRSTFPAGTLSGAPKVRAMQIIDELEPASRELYGGAVGYFGFSGNADLCIAIRTAWKKADGWHFQVGAGIVADSVPALEYDETVNKAGGILRAAELARKGL